MNRDAVFFTTASIIMIAVLISAYLIVNEYRQKDRMEVEQIRVQTIDAFVSDVEKDLSRGLYISSFRSLLAIQDFITTNNSYLDSSQARFSEAMINSTVYGYSHELLQNESFSTWTEKIQSHADRIDLIINFTIHNLTINHTTPWTLKIATDISMNVTDKKMTARWERSQHIETDLSIQGFEDPAYTLNTLGRIINPINRSESADFSDIGDLKNHINSSSYIESPEGPSFLMRLEGNLSPSPYGIESIVDLGEFENQGLAIRPESAVDYIYFSNVSQSNCLINETWQDPSYSWLRLPDTTTTYLDRYSVNCKS